jgi:hypothetical protein
MGIDLGNELNMFAYGERFDRITVEEGDAWNNLLCDKCAALFPGKIVVNGTDHSSWFFPSHAFTRPTLANTGTLTSLHTWIEFTQARRYGDESPHVMHLQDFMIEAAPESLRPAQVLVARDDERLRSAVFVSGADCIVGVGYEDHARCPKGTMMAALLLYVLAGLNMGRDMTLFKNAYNYLPFVPEIGLSYHFFEFADDLLALVADGRLEALGSQGDDPASGPSSQRAGELLSFQGSD